MDDFSSDDEIVEILEDVMTGEKPFARVLSSTSGQREDRYTHTLCGEVQIEQIKQTEHSAPKSATDSTDRLQQLEQRISALEERLQTLEDQHSG